MPKFSYIIKTTDGNSRSGQIEAPSKDAAAQLLTKDREGIFITSLSKEKEKTLGGSSIFSGRIKLQEKLFFVQQLAIMIKSGLSITAALRSLRDQTSNKTLKKILHEVLVDVKGGESLSSSLTKHPKLLDNVYVQIIASGEKSGKLDKVLLKMATDLEKSFTLQGKIRSALLYPIFLIILILIVGIIVLTTIIPQLSKMFEDAGVALPITTRILIWMSNAITQYWWLTLLVIAAIVILLWRYAKTNSGRRVFDTIKIKTPIFGRLNHKIYIARFTRTLNSLTSSGMPILEVFSTLEQIIGNVIYAEEISEARKKIESGYPVSEAVAESKHFPSVISDLIAVGEKSGNLNYVLTNITRFYERDIDETSKNLATMLEPIMMVVMGFAVAFLVAAVIMPIYGLVQVIQ